MKSRRNEVPSLLYTLIQHNQRLRTRRPPNTRQPIEQQCCGGELRDARREGESHAGLLRVPTNARQAVDDGTGDGGGERHQPRHVEE